MPLKIGQQSDHGFDQPLGLLSDCHRRIEHFLGVLTAISDRSADHELSAADRGQLEAALAYFATAAPRHTADEEDSLFPRLKAADDDRAIAALATIRGLERDHDEASRHHDAVDRMVRQWLLDNGLSADDRLQLNEHLRQLNTLYEAHIAVEDRELFPAAARILSANDLHEIGREMAARRNTK